MQWLCRQVFLSIVRVYGLLVLGDHMMEEPFFSKMTELMEKIVSWGLRSILGLTMGLQILQSLVLPYADSAGRSAIMKFAEMIPGLGQATGAAARLVFGSSDHVGTGCEAGCFNGHVSGCSGSFAACL